MVAARRGFQRAVLSMLSDVSRPEYTVTSNHDLPALRNYAIIQAASPIAFVHHSLVGQHNGDPDGNVRAGKPNAKKHQNPDMLRSALMVHERQQSQD